jgi:hypothetical protein
MILCAYVLVFIAAAGLNAQSLDMTISINGNEFNGNRRSSGDTIILSCVLKNISGEPVLLRFSEQYFILQHSDDTERSYSHCFRLYPFDHKKLYDPFFERTKEDFIRLSPGEELRFSGSFSVSWLCRGAPPKGDWKFTMRYYRNITPDDNYYLLKSYYTDKLEKEFVSEAWTGVLSSNYVEFVVK